MASNGGALWGLRGIPARPLPRARVRLPLLRTPRRVLPTAEWRTGQGFSPHSSTRAQRSGSICVGLFGRGCWREGPIILIPKISPQSPQRAQSPPGSKEAEGSRLLRIFRTMSHTSLPDLEITGASLRAWRPLRFNCIVWVHGKQPADEERRADLPTQKRSARQVLRRFWLRGQADPRRRARLANPGSGA